MNFKKFLLENPFGWTLIGIVVLSIINILYYYMTAFDKTVTVKKTYNIYRKHSKGLMFEDTNGNIYKVTNAWFKGEFDSMEDWNRLKDGEKVSVQGYGKRVPILGMYPKVYSVKAGN